MVLIALLLFSGVVLSSAVTPLWQMELTVDSLRELNPQQAFTDWMIYFDREYPSMDEQSQHYMTWLENLHYIAAHNSDSEYRGSTYKLRLNQFGDLTSDQWRFQVHGKDGACAKRSMISNIGRMDDVMDVGRNDMRLFAPTADSVDWTTKGVVTPIKNQGNCGSCWSFSATGALECRYAIKTGQLNSLSEQELVDCAGKHYDSYGCNGGEENGGMQYAADNKGLCSEAEYAYTARDGSCKASTCGTRYDANTGVTYITKYSSSALLTEVNNGCVSIAIDAGGAFQHYSSGVVDGQCGTSIDHAILVVGYGTSSAASAEAYWKVKNSWGTSWGEKGYANICRDCNKNGKDGECGILMWPSIPLF
jgi:cathepsin L